MATRRRSLVNLPVALLCGVVGACVDPVSTTIHPVDHLLAKIQSSWGASAGSYIALSSTPATTTPLSASSCLLNATVQFFMCPPRRDRGLQFDLSYQLRDAGNTALPVYNPVTVAAIRTVTEVKGTIPFGAASQTVSSRSDRTMTGVMLGAPVINGTESGVFISKAASRTDTSYMVATITNLKLAPLGSTTPWPIGVINTKYYSAPPSPTAKLSAEVTLTFDGSQMVKMVWYLSGVTATCMLDLKGVTDAVCT